MASSFDEDFSFDDRDFRNCFRNNLSSSSNMKTRNAEITRAPTTGENNNENTNSINVSGKELKELLYDPGKISTHHSSISLF